LEIQVRREAKDSAQTLTRFYLSKLDDFDSLSPALSALIVLSKQPTFDDDAAREVYRGWVTAF
jgi:DNA repair/transcription protein MET18/MMS19